MKYKNIEDLRNKIEEYFEYCEKEKKRPQKASLCVFLDVSDAWISRTVNGKDKQKRRAIKKAHEGIEAAWVDRLDKAAPVGAIFYLKNAFKETYRDRQELDVGQGKNQKPLKIIHVHQGNKNI